MNEYDIGFTLQNQKIHERSAKYGFST